jgi:amino acid adenylation domain-containing protein
MTDPALTPIRRFLRQADAFPDAAALVVDGETWTYADLFLAARSIAERLPYRAPGAAQPRVAIMADRHASSYLAILAAQLRGFAYVPVNVAHPPSRSVRILQEAGTSHVITGDLAADRLDSLLRLAPDIAAGLQRLGCGDRKADYAISGRPGRIDTPDPHGDDLAYILFTSGSTGVPKGVPVGMAQLAAYLDAVEVTLPLAGRGDRFSQTFDLTFDLSVHDIFVSLTRGGTLVVPSRGDLERPADFIRRMGISQWFSVPSLAYQMRLQGQLQPAAFPGLKTSLFCGEALPASLALEWLAATPNGAVENWYGPTEATIACARYPVVADAKTGANVPLGRAFPGTGLHVLDDVTHPLPKGAPGELYLSGKQVNAGYLNAPDQTRHAFVTLPDGTAAYRTGDRALVNADGDVVFLGRIDNQVKVRGYRIELPEIEAVLRDVSGGCNAVALTWPHGDTAPRAIVAAVEGQGLDAAALLAGLAGRLPDYMVPTDIHILDRFPQNASGKTDRAGTALVIQERLAAFDDTSRALSPFQGRVMAAILGVAPALTATRVLAAGNLLDAGMDSLSFINFTMAVEAEFRITLDQDQVVALSELPFERVAAELGTLTQGPIGAAGPIQRLARRIAGLFHMPKRGPKTRVRRVHQFIHHFPGLIASPGPPFVLVVGSSGVLRGFVPDVLQKVAAQNGIAIRALNIGLPAVTPQGLARICDFIRDTCQKAGVRVPLVIWEFDPMHVSTTPPSGDIMLGPEFFQPHAELPPATGAAVEFDWNPGVGGAWMPPAGGLQPDRQPDWVRKRDRLIARAYRGDFTIDRERFAAWKRGAVALKQVADRVVCFLPPADKAMLDEVPLVTGVDAMAKAIAEVTRDLSLGFIPADVFKLDRTDFLDINHANATGRQVLTRQLSEYLVDAGLLKATD